MHGLSWAWLILALFPQPAAATSIAYQGLGKASLVRIAVTGAGPAWANTSIWSREYKWSPDPGAVGYEIYAPTFYLYSLDLLKVSLRADSVAARSTDLLSVSGVPDAGGRIAWRFNTYAPGFRSSGRGATGDTVDVNQSAVALQVAIWKAMLDASNDVLSGTLKVNSTSAVKTQTIAYLSDMYSRGPSGYDNVAATWLDIDKVRDPVDLPGVPEPASAVLLVTGLAVIFVIHRRTRRLG